LKALCTIAQVAVFLVALCTWPENCRGQDSDPGKSDTPPGPISQADLGESDTQESTYSDADEFDFGDDDWGDEELAYDDAMDPPQTIWDPLVGWNRVMYQINDRLYYWVLKPLALGYKAVTPNPLRSGVSNFFRNLAAPLRITSCTLQGKGDAAAGELARFYANTTAGILGVLDVTKDYPDLNPEPEDMGQALGKWGVGNGPYLFWPLLGPSTLRDTVGRAVDRFLNPTTYIEPNWASVAASGLEQINYASYRIDDYETLKKAAIEPYEAFRDAYYQNRKKAIAE